MKFITALILISLFITFPAKVHGQSFNLSIYPPIIQINAKPPANITTPISIENLGNESITLDLILKPFEASDRENGQVKYLEDIPDDYSFIFERVVVLDGASPISELTLGPKQKKIITLGINVPRETIPSDYYFSLVFSNNSITNEPDRSGTQLLGGIATNILLSVAGEREVKALIQEFSTPLFLEKGPVSFTVRIKNTGSHYISPEGEIIISNLLGQTVGKVELLPVNILAQSVRSIPSHLDSVESLWKEDLLIGPYKATLNVSLSENGPSYKQEVFFFVFPGITILAGLSTIIALLYLFTRVKSKV